MSDFKTNLMVGLTSVLGMGALVCCLVGCAAASDSSVETPTGTSQLAGVEEVADLSSVSEHRDILLDAKLGDVIDFDTYLYSISEGVKTYYVSGKYVLASASTEVDEAGQPIFKVVQTRQEIEVPDVTTTLAEIISWDEAFEVEKATVSFYSADGTKTNGTLDSTLSSTVTDCVIEYADWEDDTQTFGAVQSYIFTYGYVPTKICGYYQADASTNTSSGTTSDVTSDADTNTSESSTTESEVTESAAE